MVAKTSLDLKSIAERTQRRVDTVVNEVTQDLAETVVERTPVDIGFLRGSWFVAINEDSAAYQGTPDKTGAQTVARLSLDISQATVGDVIGVLNGASYADDVELGTARMAPRSMVRSTVADAPRIIEGTIRRIRR